MSTVPRTEFSLATPVRELPGVSPRDDAALGRLGIRCVAHLLIHYPHRHEHIEAEACIRDLAPGRIVTARGEITAVRPVARGARPRFEAVMLDHSGRLDLVWFNQAYLNKAIRPGMRLRVHGKSKRLGQGLQLANPAFEVLHEPDADPASSTDRWRPVYPSSDAMPSDRLERIIGSILDRAAAQIDDHLSPAFRAQRQLPSLADAYRMIHRPASREDTIEARRRLAYDELLLLQLGVHMRRAFLRRKHRAPSLRWNTQIDRRIRARIPFTLTPGQESVIRETARDLTASVPANRLIQGDVGSGKTVVALYMMLLAVASGHQAALMVPTELLAEQHHATITQLLKGSDVRIERLTGSLSTAERSAAHRRIARGEAHIVIGTHALISGGVEFKSLAVAVIDEQHRFGVHQRAALRAKSSEPASTPHTLVMTATPIPRTLSLTIFGDLDISTLIGLPPGRSPVKTRLVTPSKSNDVYTYLRKRVERGEQAYVVVPAVGSEDAEDTGSGGSRRAADVRSTLQRLEAGPLAGLRIAAVHGQLKSQTREATMNRFRAGLIDVLVATTVIEVGVDVPNATVMVIDQAERFGIAQLHQLRGRIGRGAGGGVCALIATDQASPEALSRLKAVASTTDGFRLAEADFELRGPGDVFGGRQSGLAPFRVVEFPKDTNLLLMARRDAAEWIERSPELSKPDETLVRSRLMKAYGKGLGLGDVA